MGMNFKNIMSSAVRMSPQNNSKLAQANKMASEITKKMEEFDQKEFESDYQNGAIKVKLLGNLSLVSLDINKDLIDPDEKQTLEEMICEAINAASKKITDEKDEITAQFMPKGMGGLF